MTDIERHINAWKWAVAGSPRGEWPEVIETHNNADYTRICTALNTAQVEANRAGFVCRANGMSDSKSGRKSMWITANGQRLKVEYRQKPRRQAVTETSIEAYRRLDATTQRGRVAEFIREKTADGSDITRQEISAWMGIPINSICGRVYELINSGIARVVCKRLSRLENATEQDEALQFAVAHEEKQVRPKLF